MYHLPQPRVCIDPVQPELHSKRSQLGCLLVGIPHPTLPVYCQRGNPHPRHRDLQPASSCPGHGALSSDPACPLPSDSPDTSSTHGYTSHPAPHDTPSAPSRCPLGPIPSLLSSSLLAEVRVGSSCCAGRHWLWQGDSHLVQRVHTPLRVVAFVVLRSPHVNVSGGLVSLKCTGIDQDTRGPMTAHANTRD